MLVLSVNITSATASRFSGGSTTVSSAPGRFFFIMTGAVNTSNAPAA